MAYRYPTIKVDGKTKLKHRHLAEQKLGRKLRPNEQVHHRDHDGWNCDPDNLEVKVGGDHRQLHADERLVFSREKICEVCGITYTPHRNKRKRSKTCSPKCANTLRTRNSEATKARLRDRVCPPLAAALVAANCADMAVLPETEVA